MKSPFTGWISKVLNLDVVAIDIFIKVLKVNKSVDCVIVACPGIEPELSSLQAIKKMRPSYFHYGGGLWTRSLLQTLSEPTMDFKMDAVFSFMIKTGVQSILIPLHPYWLLLHSCVVGWLTYLPLLDSVVFLSNVFLTHISRGNVSTSGFESVYLKTLIPGFNSIKFKTERPHRRFIPCEAEVAVSPYLSLTRRLVRYLYQSRIQPIPNKLRQT